MQTGTKRRLFFLLFLLLGATSLWLLRQFRLVSFSPSTTKTVEDRLKEYGREAEARFRPAFDVAGISYPPAAISFLAFKAERRMDLYARNADGPFRLIKSYPILAASGVSGPKLREGDRQVPEGFYKIESLNPNSLYHLSLRVNYPNKADIARAREEGRDEKNLGSDIMIHGNSVSIGCIAIGDPAIEEVFTIAANVGLKNLTLIISPCDFRTGANEDIPTTAPEWTSVLHENIRKSLRDYRQ